MLERDEAELVAYLAERPGQAVFALRGGDDETGLAALHRAATAVRQIPHPDEPGDALVSWVEALPGDDGPTLRLDLGDHGKYAGTVMAAILAALDTCGAGGRLEPRRPPPQPFEYDPRADILPGVSFLDELDARGLPPVFPVGFPVPVGGTLVIAQRATRDTWQHAGWRRSRPFDDYPDTLVRFGCELTLVTTADRLTRGTGMTRHLLRHPSGTGSVSTYHEYEPRTTPTVWYVSVVWRPT